MKPTTQFPFPETITIISVLYKLTELYWAYRSMLFYSSIFYTALHPAFFHLDSMSWRAFCVVHLELAPF